MENRVLSASLVLLLAGAILPSCDSDDTFVRGVRTQHVPVATYYTYSPPVRQVVRPTTSYYYPYSYGNAYVSPFSYYLPSSYNLPYKYHPYGCTCTVCRASYSRHPVYWPYWWKRWGIYLQSATQDGHEHSHDHMVNTMMHSEPPAEIEVDARPLSGEQQAEYFAVQLTCDDEAVTDLVAQTVLPQKSGQLAIFGAVEGGLDFDMGDHTPYQGEMVDSHHFVVNRQWTDEASDIAFEIASEASGLFEGSDRSSAIFQTGVRLATPVGDETECRMRWVSANERHIGN